MAVRGAVLDTSDSWWAIYYTETKPTVGNFKAALKLISPTLLTPGMATLAATIPLFEEKMNQLNQLGWNSWFWSLVLSVPCQIMVLILKSPMFLVQTFAMEEVQWIFQLGKLLPDLTSRVSIYISSIRIIVWEIWIIKKCLYNLLLIFWHVYSFSMNWASFVHPPYSWLSPIMI